MGSYSGICGGTLFLIFEYLKYRPNVNSVYIGSPSVLLVRYYKHSAASAATWRITVFLQVSLQALPDCQTPLDVY